MVEESIANVISNKKKQQQKKYRQIHLLLKPSQPCHQVEEQYDQTVYVQ